MRKPLHVVRMGRTSLLKREYRSLTAPFAGHGFLYDASFLPFAAMMPLVYYCSDT